MKLRDVARGQVMKKFFLKILIFGVLYICIVGFFVLLSADERWKFSIAELTKSNEYIYENFGSNEIIPYIRRVQEKNEYTKLILGDSVCNQVFERYYGKNDVYCICGTNQAVSIAGQYLLAKEFVENHENVTDIYLVIIMDSLTTTYNAQFGYQYAVMPFVETGTIGNLDQDTRKEISNMYGSIFCQKSVVKMIHESPLCMKLYLNLLAKKNEAFPRKAQGLISDLSYRYLGKIQELCEERGIQFHLIPGPHADSEDQRTRAGQVYSEAEEKGDTLGIREYVGQIVYYPEELFRDRVHFDGEKVGDIFFQDLAKSLVPGIKVE